MNTANRNAQILRYQIGTDLELALAVFLPHCLEHIKKADSQREKPRRNFTPAYRAYSRRESDVQESGKLVVGIDPRNKRFSANRNCRSFFKSSNGEQSGRVRNQNVLAEKIAWLKKRDRKTFAVFVIVIRPRSSSSHDMKLNSVFVLLNDRLTRLKNSALEIVPDGTWGNVNQLQQSDLFHRDQG